MTGRTWLPTRDEWVDLAFLGTLSVLALIGLAPTYAGIGFAVVGVLGLVLGVVVARVSRSLGWPFVAPVMLTLACYALLGAPIVLRRWPGPDALRLLADHALFGWKDLLTTLPPVDADSTLLSLPWLLGLATGLLGTLAASLAVSSRGRGLVAVVLPVLVPTALLALVILLGVREPQSLWLQGVAYAALALGWLAVRSQRRVVHDAATDLGSRVRRLRLVSGAVLVAVAAALALPVATWSSGAEDHRLVLRDHVEPPFDVGRYPSPLASFRRYVEQPKPDPENLYDQPLMTVSGVEPGTRIRFAALDEYDGVVWGASNDSTFGGPVEGTFQRVSSQISNPATGPQAEVTIELEEGWSGVWLPTVGALTGMEFGGERAAAQAETFRYNLATSTGVVPGGLQPGDRYTLRTTLTDAELTGDTAPASFIGLAQATAGFLTAQAQDWSAGSTRPMEQVLDIADRLKSDGKYSDGVRASERFYLPGHHQARLSDADGGINSPIIVGNDEQYAAWMALLANQIGVPARVVMGAVVPEGGNVKGEDVQAWVEVQAADGTWRTVPTELFMDFDRPAELPPREEEQMSGTNVPPPAAIPPPSTVGEPTDAELNALRNKRETDDGFSLPGWLVAVLTYVVVPLLLMLAVAGVILGAKTLRRRRRRSAESVSARFAGGWREVTDHARDLGVAVTGVTRREESLVLTGVGASGQAPTLAQVADSHVFGPRPPQPDAAAAYWEAVDAYRSTMSAGVSRARRLRAALSLRTFRLHR
ncbi:transglutaminase-like domain-containing protein [Nocardioides sp.]|uniref:transglutaminase-like domain-containing protein n=1 Tax=Nocardioides sp. TaxID=35761 RepID=UPI002ED61A8F